MREVRRRSDKRGKRGKGKVRNERKVKFRKEPEAVNIQSPLTGRRYT